MTTTLARPPAPLRQRMHPSREQLRVAAAMFRVATEDVTSVVVPVAAPEPDVAAAAAVRPDPALEFPGGYWLADRATREGAYGYRAARDAARDAAQAHLRRHGRAGVPGWVTIRPDGSWTALDGA